MSLSNKLRWAPLACLLSLAPLASAGDAPPPPSPAAPGVAQPYDAAELEAIVGPIALYPDIVVSSILPASTFPTDVVAASRWLATQTGEIAGAPEGSTWDAAVQAMIQFPDVLKWMSDNPEWMEQLAYAVSVQQGEVLAAIQDFRKKCKDAGNLQSNDKVVIVNDQPDVIVIQPASPTVVYVPTYDPVAVIRPAYVWPTFWAGFAMGAMGAWAWHNVGWGSHGSYGSINVNRSAEFNFTNNGNINTGNISGGNRWNSANTNVNRQPDRRPNQARPSNPTYGNNAGGARPAAGGVKPGNAPTDRRPANTQRPGGAPTTRPAGGGAGSGPTRPSTPTTRPSTPPSRPTPSAGGRDSFGGSSTSGRTTRDDSSRGKGSMSGGGGGGRSGGGGGGGRSGGGGGGGRGGRR